MSWAQRHLLPSKPRPECKPHQRARQRHVQLWEPFCPAPVDRERVNLMCIATEIESKKDGSQHAS